jgi:lipoprotein signal peptidase
MTKTKWLGVAAVIVVADQLSKLWVAGRLDLYQRIELLPFFNLTHVHNTGAAFSFLADAGGWQRWFFLILAVVISLFIGRYLWRLDKRDQWQSAGLSLILGGALGNFIDRARLGYVIDFLDFYFQQWHWPAFNIADSAITIGVALLIIDSLRNQSSKDNEEPDHGR